MHVVDDIYSKTYSLGAINYTTAHTEKQKQILSQYNKAINQLSEKEHYQLTLLVTKNPKGKYMKETAYSLKNDQGDVLREELNEIVEANYDAGRNNWNVDRFITLGTHAENTHNAEKRLLNISEAFADEMMTVKAAMDELDGLQRLKIMNKILRPGKPLYGDFKDIERSKRTTKDLIAPNYLDFKRSGKIDFQMDDHYGQVLYLRDFPRNLSDSMCKKLTEAEAEMVITIHATPYSIEKTTKKLRSEATDLETDVIKREMKAIVSIHAPLVKNSYGCRHYQESMFECWLLSHNGKARMEQLELPCSSIKPIFLATGHLIMILIKALPGTIQER